jgi:hypothetical protein
MNMFTATVLLFTMIGSAPAQTAKTFDKFKHKTTFSTKATKAGAVSLSNGTDASILIHSMGVVVAFGCDGQAEGCDPQAIELLFIASTSDWRMNGQNEVNLLIDGKPDSAGKASWDGQVLDAEDLREYLDTNIGPKLLVKLANAKTVDVQIGVFQFSLTPSNIAAFKDIATHLKG